MPGYLALILHAHLPFVRHPEHEHFLEEDWFFEAVTESYIPLLRMMQRLMGDDVPFKLTMSLTPTLCAMLQDQLFRERYVHHFDNLIDLTAREQRRNRKHPQLRELADFYFDMFSEDRRFFVDEWKCDLPSAFRELRSTGQLEIIASAATHGLLPILQQQTPQAARAQLLIGRDVYVDLFGAEPIGFWLPECAYEPELESLLQEANIRWFVLDAHGLMFGKPPPRRAIYAPCFTPAGPAIFARDRDSSRQVWSAHEGYPGNPAYREFYRDVGFDLSMEHLGPIARGQRKFAGMKYHRITGRGEEKELYDREAAEKAAETHAAHFLEQFIRKAAIEQDLRLTTPSEYLAAHPTLQTIQPAASTWGENGHLSVWLDPGNAWIYPHLHAAARRMSDVASKHAGDMTSFADNVLKQLARELLLAQSSDWAFLMKTGTAREYATKRTMDHLARFNQLHDQFTANDVDEEFLHDCEARDNVFPNVNWRYYI